MIDISVPGFGELHFSHLVLDFNGTLAGDGLLIDGVEKRLARLAAQLRIHIVTADTFGSVQQMFADTPYTVFILPAGEEEKSKASYVQELGVQSCVCIGNGRNDRLMLKESALGIAVQQQEGLALEALLAADLITTSIIDALDLLIHPLRLTASLRN
ncbi:MAG: ATPase P [Proteobacteria bacterium]|nr:ATPase P [Pseudomonadota bacterium]MBU4295230.1 ATPase P [Pseudomonadota bacterium]MCG2750164.1 ATPase P [Desulfobulbaceae bacterium]